MPQATTKLAKEWKGPSEDYAIGYLEGRGFVLNRKWQWENPRKIRPIPKDYRAMSFLMQEWDFGGFAG